jgi:hypothetical protein
MAVLAAVPDFRLVLKDDNLFGPAVLLGGGHDPGPFHDRFAERDVGAVSQEQYFVQLDGVALSYIQSFNTDGLAFGYFILFAAGFNYSVNIEPPNEILYQLYGFESRRGLKG